MSVFTMPQPLRAPESVLPAFAGTAPKPRSRFWQLPMLLLGSFLSLAGCSSLPGGAGPSGGSGLAPGLVTEVQAATPAPPHTVSLPVSERKLRLSGPARGALKEPGFLEKVERIAADLRVQPEWLLTVMNYETAGSMSPRARNPKSGATGLIQFMPSTAARLGTSLPALAKMSGVRQLDYVHAYFRPFKGRMHSVVDVYLAVFTPAAMGKARTDTVYSRKDGKKYTQNAGFDTNRDGRITVAEITREIRRWAVCPVSPDGPA